MIGKAIVTAVEIKKGLGFIGDLEDINIAVLDNGTQVRYSVIMPKDAFVKAMNLSATDVTAIETAVKDGLVTSADIATVGEVTGKVKRGRKATVANP